MIIVHLNNELIHFSQNEMPACLYLSASRYKNTNHTLYISIEILSKVHECRFENLPLFSNYVKILSWKCFIVNLKNYGVIHP